MAPVAPAANAPAANALAATAPDAANAPARAAAAAPYSSPRAGVSSRAAASQPLASAAYTSPVGRGWVAAGPEGVLRVELPGTLTPVPPPSSRPERTDEDAHAAAAAAHRRQKAAATARAAATTHRSQEAVALAEAHLEAALAWLEAYFGDPGGLPPRPPLAAAGTPFQRAVWQAIDAIPLGQTLSYGELATTVAAKLGRPPGAARAAGAACGANPLPLLVPCHRVVGGDGSLTGFGGGLELKRWLLRHEGAL